MRVPQTVQAQCNRRQAMLSSWWPSSLNTAVGLSELKRNYKSIAAGTRFYTSWQNKLEGLLVAHNTRQKCFL